jgi:hypothetical protein
VGVSCVDVSGNTFWRKANTVLSGECDVFWGYIKVLEASPFWWRRVRFEDKVGVSGKIR